MEFSFAVSSPCVVGLTHGISRETAKVKIYLMRRGLGAAHEFDFHQSGNSTGAYRWVLVKERINTHDYACGPQEVRISLEPRFPGRVFGELFFTHTDSRGELISMDRDTKIRLLKDISFGSRVAEDEADNLEAYFLETEEWRKLYGGSIDIIYGEKGAGKSALYLLINKKSSELFDKAILLAAGEQVRGTTIFAELRTDPPVGETEFVRLWKLYILVLVAQLLKEFGIANKPARELCDALADAKLIEEKWNIRRFFARVRTYLKGRTVDSIEGAMTIDPVTTTPAFNAKVTFSEKASTNNLSLLDAFDLAQESLSLSGYRVWLLFDRLDVAFAENVALETNALRALFRTYLDLKNFDSISLKVFLRSDIWRRITDAGFREASHITSSVNLQWKPDALLNLAVKRIISNEALCRAYRVNPVELIGNIDRQREIFYKLFPRQVDIGEKKPRTFDWLLSRTKDGQQRNTPRELVHLLEEIRRVQIKRYERGEPGPTSHELFNRSAIKEALSEVLKVRLEQTLLAEYPDLRDYIARLRGVKAEQYRDTLARIWECDPDQASKVADKVVEIGLFEVRSGQDQETTYWAPFMYRDALELVQGKAE